MKSSHRTSRTRTHSRKTDKRAKERRLAYQIFAGVAAVVVAAAGVAVLAKKPDLDALTGCPIGNEAPEAHTLILVDATDSLSPADLQFGRSLILTEYHWLPIGGRLTVRGITSDPEEARDITLCRMHERSSTGGTLDNDRHIRRQFERGAGRQLKQLFEDLEEVPAQEASPIMESISEAVDRPDFGTNVASRRLVVYSDLAQHSDLVSHYGRGAAPARSLPDAAAAELDRDMTGLAVRLQYIPRRSLAHIQGQTHRQMWRDHLAAMGAEVEVGHTLLLGEPADRPTWIYAPDS